MILSDSDILGRLQDDDDFRIDGIGDVDLQVQPASVDLRLGNDFITFDHTNIPYIDPYETDVDEFTTLETVDDGDVFMLHPGDFILGTTMENVKVPDDLLAHVQGRSSIGRLAVIIHATAGIVDPGYKGEITLELANLGRIPIALHPGMRISQVIYSQLKNPADRPYGSERDSKYQNQDGPQASKVSNDPEFASED